MEHAHVRKTLEELVAEIDTVEREQVKRRILANGLCERMGEEPRYPDVEPKATSGAFGIPSDLYYTKPLATSARDVLQRRKSVGLGAMPLDDLYAMMVRGGFKFDAKNDGNAKRALSTALSKNPVFTKLPNDDIGLTEWYDLPARAKTKATKTEQAQTENGGESAAAESDEEYQNEFADQDAAADAAKGKESTPAKK
jgi:hypothetical protein